MMKRLFKNKNNSMQAEPEGEEEEEGPVSLPPPPGATGYCLIWDHSLSFYRGPVKFVEDMQKMYSSPIFACRFLKQQTIFLCNHPLVHQILTAVEGDVLVPGYSMFLGNIYGPNILFHEGVPAMELREALMKVFSERAVYDYQRCMNQVLDRHFVKLADMSAGGRKIDMYKFLKRVVTEVCLSVFLGLDFEQSKEFADTIVKLTIDHWHGIISVPVNVKVPGIARTNYAKAMDAKKELLAIIRELRKNSGSSWMFCKHMKSCWKDLNSRSRKFSAENESASSSPRGSDANPRYSEDDMDRHFLLFTSALIPKALASLLIWAMVELGRNKSWQDLVRVDEQFREFVLLEVQRFYPPFFAGYRILRQGMDIDGYFVAAGTAVIYVTYTAHRDPNIYADPDKFFPQRWKYCLTAMRDMFSFGAGPRSCIGQNMTWAIVNEILNRMLQRFSWKLLEAESDLEPKWLPVSRPKGCALFNLTILTGDDSDVDADDLEAMVDHTLMLAGVKDIVTQDASSRVDPLLYVPRADAVPYHLQPQAILTEDMAEKVGSEVTYEMQRGRSLERRASDSSRARSLGPISSTRSGTEGQRMVMMRAQSCGPGLKLRLDPLVADSKKCPCKHVLQYPHARIHQTRGHPSPAHLLGPAAYKKFVLHGGHFVTDHELVHDRRVPCMPGSERELGRSLFLRKSPLPEQHSHSWLVNHPAPRGDHLSPHASSRPATSSGRLGGPEASSTKLGGPASSSSRLGGPAASSSRGGAVALPEVRGVSPSQW